MIFDRSLDFILNKIHANRQFTDGYISSDNQEAFFNKLTNRKSNGSLRLIYAPKTDEHANIYKALYEELKPYQDRLHDAAHGFRKGRSNVTNAAAHLAAEHLFNIDIENFYGHITKEAVVNVFISLGASFETAEYLASLCTVNGTLPQGFNTSPDIANHYLYKLDGELAEYCGARSIIYTRYVDDMSFSSDKQIEASEICEIVNTYGLPIAESKRKYQKRGSNQYVTGLTIFDDKKPRIAKKYKRRLRLELHVIDKIGINDFVINQYELPEKPDNQDEAKEWMRVLNTWADNKLAKVRGKIDYINGVEPDLASRMYPLLRKIIEDRKVANDTLVRDISGSAMTIEEFLSDAG